MKMIWHTQRQQSTHLLVRLTDVETEQAGEKCILGYQDDEVDELVEDGKGGQRAIGLLKGGESQETCVAVGCMCGSVVELCIVTRRLIGSSSSEA